MKRSFILILLIIATGIASAQKSRDHYLSGIAKMKTGHADSAIYFLNMAIMQEPDNYQYYLHRGEIKYSQGRYEEALRDFENIDPLKTGMADLWQAKCYARLDNNELAVGYLKQHLQSPDRLPQKEIQKDEAFDRLQLTDEWYELWQNEWYSDEELLEEDIDYLIGQAKYLDALSVIDKKLRDSKKPEVLYRYRASVEDHQGNYRASAMDWTEVISRNKNDYSSYKARGIAFLNAKKFSESADDLSRAIRMEPADFELYRLRAKAYKGQNDLKSAIKDISTYLNYFPDDEDILLFSGELQYEDGNYVDALRSFNRCLKINNSNPGYYKARGKTYFQTGLYKYAIEDLSMSLDLNARDGETYYYKGLARFHSGDEPGACDDWKESAYLGEARAVEQLIKHCR
ncbi:MAG: tetratricopeptide repeat protein [Bacteroidales bacterium]|nr:tetratricopeptide repeat protein [Bacteroidales bacterium]